MGDKLWATLRTFEDAETNEQFSQVAVSCRRLIEYVVDCIFPPTNGEYKGHKLGLPHYRNRLLAYADKERKSDTNINLIVTSTEMLNELIEKLSKLTDKGVHSEFSRNETRRCLLRTILLLDDIISLKRNAFPIKPEINYDILHDIFKVEKEEPFS